MNSATRKILQTTLRADGTIPPGTIIQVLNLLDGRQNSGSEPLPLLLTQAETARQLSCSRFTIKRLVEDRVLGVVKLRGLTRYRQADVERLAAEDPNPTK